MRDDYRHVVLAGDSIFDNDIYVREGEPGVIAQLRRAVPETWCASKIAVDGDCIPHVEAQLRRLQPDATDIVLSIGGNDLIGYSHLIGQVGNSAELAAVMVEPLARTVGQYASLLDQLSSLPQRLLICTVYTAIPFSELNFRALAPHAIGRFNELITAEARKRSIPVLPLHRICTDPADFSALSPIEPSMIGGQKIVDAIVATLIAEV